MNNKYQRSTNKVIENTITTDIEPMNGLVEKVIRLPICRCRIVLRNDESKGRWDGGTIETDWHTDWHTDIMDKEVVGYNAAIDGIEALVLAHAIAGINVESPAYIEGIETAIDGALNNI